MDDYAREMMELKTLVTRTLEKKGVLAKIRAELRASVFEAIEEEDRVVENDDGGNPALLGSCNDRAKQLHASPSGRLLTALVCEYLEWAQLSRSMKVYLPECNLPKDFWKNELKDFSNKSGAEGSRSAESGPKGYLKYENLSQTRMGVRRMMSSESDPALNAEHQNMRRPSSSSSVGSLPPIGRAISSSQTSAGGWTDEEMPNKKPVTIDEEVPGKKPGTVNEGVPGYRTYEGPLLWGSKITLAELVLDSRYREFLQNKTVHVVKGSFPPRVLAAEVDELGKGARLQNNEGKLKYEMEVSPLSDFSLALEKAIGKHGSHPKQVIRF